MKIYLRLITFTFLFILLGASCEKDNDKNVTTAFDGTYNGISYAGSKPVASWTFIINKGIITGSTVSSGQTVPSIISGSININAQGVFTGSITESGSSEVTTISGTILDNKISGIWTRIEEGSGTFSGSKN